MYILKLPFKIKGVNSCIAFTTIFTNEKRLPRLWYGPGKIVVGRGAHRGMRER